MQEGILKKVNEYASGFVNSITNTVKTNIESFINSILNVVKFMLIGRGILEVAIGIVVGFIIMQLNAILVDDVVAPIIYRFIDPKPNEPNNNATLDDFKYSIYGVKFPLGRTIVNLLKVIIIGSILYNIYFMKVKF
jgi:hypothetical protein